MSAGHLFEGFETANLLKAQVLTAANYNVSKLPERGKSDGQKGWKSLYRASHGCKYAQARKVLHFYN